MSIFNEKGFNLIQQRNESFDFANKNEIKDINNIIYFLYYLHYIIINKIETNIMCFENFNDNLIIETSINALKIIFKNNLVFLSKMDISKKNELLDFLFKFYQFIELKNSLINNVYKKFCKKLQKYLPYMFKNEKIIFNDLFIENEMINNFQNFKLRILYIIEIIKLSNKNLEYLLSNNLLSNNINGNKFVANIFNISNFYYSNILNHCNSNDEILKIDNIINLYDKNNLFFSELTNNLIEYSDKIEIPIINKKNNNNILEILKNIYENIEIFNEFKFSDDKFKNFYKNIKDLIILANFNSNNYEINIIFNELIKVFNHMILIKKIDKITYFLIKSKIKVLITIYDNFEYI